MVSKSVPEQINISSATNDSLPANAAGYSIWEMALPQMNFTLYFSSSHAGIFEIASRGSTMISSLLNKLPCKLLEDIDGEDFSV